MWSEKPKSLPFQLGFTLIELITVIVLLGIVSIFVAPRMFDSNAFNARGFHDETLAFMRFAQKSAIAQRRTVCVTFSINSAVLTISSSALTTNCNTALRGPNGTNPGTTTARNGIKYKTLPTDFNFDALGQPVNASGVPEPTQIFQVNNAANTITIETVTGYVHE